MRVVRAVAALQPDDARHVDALAGWVRGRADEIAARSTDSIWAEVDAYADLADDSLKADVIAHCRQVFTSFLTSVELRRDPLPADFPWTAQHATRRVELGISLSAFMQAFRVGQITLWDEILDGVRALPETKDAALTIVHQVMSTIEVGSTAAAEAYLAAQQYKLADTDRVERDLLEDLLAGRRPHVERRLALLKSAGITDDSHLLVLTGRLVVPQGAEPAGPDSMAMVRRTLDSQGNGLVVVRHNEIVAVLPTPPEKVERELAIIRRGVASLAGRNVFPSVGVSTLRNGVGEVPEAYEEARLARRTLAGTTGVMSLSQMSTLDYFVQCHDRTARRLIRPEVRAFVRDDLSGDGVHVETLKQYVGNDLNAKLTAMTLHVHVNTVYYRLERIAERTGCDVRNVEELIDLLLAVRLVRSER